LHIDPAPRVVSRSRLDAYNTFASTARSSSIKDSDARVNMQCRADRIKRSIERDHDFGYTSRSNTRSISIGGSTSRNDTK